MKNKQDGSFTNLNGYYNGYIYDKICFTVNLREDTLYRHVPGSVFVSVLDRLLPGSAYMSA